MNVFDEMGAIWAEIANKNRTKQQLQFLKRNLKADGYILDLACGTGRHSIPLSTEGYCMVGFDVSERLLMIAKKLCSDVQLVRGDLRFLPFKTEAFTTAISMDTSLGYLPSEKEDLESLAETRRVLKVGGKSIVDVFNRSHLAAKYNGKEPMQKTIDYPNFTLQQIRTVRENGDWLCDSWTVKNKTESQVRVFEHRVRLYEASRLKGMLENVCFEVTAFLGGYEGQSFSDSSPRLIIIASAK